MQGEEAEGYQERETDRQPATGPQTPPEAPEAQARSSTPSLPRGSRASYAQAPTCAHTHLHTAARPAAALLHSADCGG